jgi:HEAT repeat protein
MGKVIDFYKSLNKQNRIIFWVCTGIIFLTILRVSIWSAKKDKTPTAKTFIKQIRSQNKNEKKYGIYNAGVLKLKDALPEIEDVFQKENDEEIKRVCAWSIGQIDFNKLLTYLDSSDKKIKEITFETLLKIDRKNIDYIIGRFDKEDVDTKLRILDYINSPEYQEKLLKILENDKEEIQVRKKALDILKEKGKPEEIETSLWALYYNEQNDEMKNYIYQIIKEIQKRGKK